MPTINNIKYNSMPKQVQQNKEDIIDLGTKDTEQDLRMDQIDDELTIIESDIIDLNEEVDGINEVLASGGVLVSRRVATNADVLGTGVLVKMQYDTVVKESNDLAIISYDANGDHVLKFEGTYTVQAGFQIQNTLGVVKTANLYLVAIDTVTLAETIIDSRSVDVPSASTMQVNPSYDYTRPAGNDILLVVRQNCEIGLTILDESSLGVTSQFTIGGTGIATKTGNIGPTTVANEGVLGTEATLAEILENIKTYLIKQDGSFTKVMSPDGTNRMNISSTAISLFVQLAMGTNKITNVGDPTSAQDAVTKSFLEIGITSGSSANTALKRAGVTFFELESTGNLISVGANRRVRNIGNPVDAQDVATKNYVDTNYIKDTLLDQASPVTGTLYTISTIGDYKVAMAYFETTQGNVTFMIPNENDVFTVIAQGGNYLTFECGNGTDFKITAVSGLTVSNAKVIGIN